MDSSLTQENFQKAANELKGEYPSMLVGCDLACASSDVTSVTVVDNLTATTVNTITKCDEGYYTCSAKVNCDANGYSFVSGLTVNSPANQDDYVAAYNAKADNIATHCTGEWSVNTIHFDGDVKPLQAGDVLPLTTDGTVYPLTVDGTGNNIYIPSITTPVMDNPFAGIWQAEEKWYPVTYTTTNLTIGEPDDRQGLVLKGNRKRANLNFK